VKVVDSSVVVAALKRELHPDDLGDEPLAAPHLLDSEVLQALRGNVLGGELTVAEGRRAVEAFGALAITRHSTAGLHERIWALRHNLTAYDATYVALAEALDAALLTRDGPLSRAPGIRCAVEVL
jgi:predicted nucleic acid-binding protein